MINPLDIIAIDEFRPESTITLRRTVRINEAMALAMRRRMRVLTTLLIAAILACVIIPVAAKIIDEPLSPNPSTAQKHLTNHTSSLIVPKNVFSPICNKCFDEGGAGVSEVEITLNTLGNNESVRTKSRGLAWFANSYFVGYEVALSVDTDGLEPKGGNPVILRSQAPPRNPPQLTALDYNRSGSAYYNKGEYDRAIVDFDKAIELDPKLADAYNWGVLARDKAGRQTEALIAYKRYLELPSTDIELREQAKLRVRELSTDPMSVAVSANFVNGAEMVYIPAGVFTMGSNDYNVSHTVYLDAYEIGKYEVTVGQYRKFCTATGRAMPDAPGWGWKENHPIVMVSWQDAADYALWAGGRLPTEAEWEKAARGTDGRKYSWGNDWDSSKCANSVGTGLNSTQPVGSYPAGASPYGCMDMTGNVWEWCADWYDENYYNNSPSRNPKGPTSGIARVLRGGSWSGEDYDNFCCVGRYYSDPAARYSRRGFRCARTP
jgi:sulfatase modifying factor 1